MDRTLTLAKRKNRRRQGRNARAWQQFSPDGWNCRFCPHDYRTHLSASAQPHIYRLATQEEEKERSVRLYRYLPPLQDKGRRVLLRRITVAKNAEIVATFCAACAKELDTAQVLCYQRTLATGEVVGVR